VTIAIVGAGLIGTSVALAARRRWREARVLTLDRGEALAPIGGAELVVLATPIDVILELLRRQAPVLGRAVVLDTGSTKRAIVAAARGQGLARFVGGHPMAGAAASGPAHARADLFEGRPWFLVPHGASGEALHTVETFVAALGATPVVFDDDGSEHDRVMAAVSHLPQIVASALMCVCAEAAGERGLAWAGAGLRDTTRLASSPPSMWEGILSTNADAVAPLLRTLADRLLAVSAALGDREHVRALFAAAARARARLE
jgi:prephenate dehydrogenase